MTPQVGCAARRPRTTHTCPYTNGVPAGPGVGLWWTPAPWTRRPDRSVGVSCLAEQRMIEAIESGAARTPFLRFGDRVKIEMLDRDGRSIFGAIDQRVESYRN